MASSWCGGSEMSPARTLGKDLVGLEGLTAVDVLSSPRVAHFRFVRS